MKIVKYVLLGFIQGFTEPLPISSSGHLKIFRCLFNDSVLNDLNFEIIVNLGSLIAIIFLYRKTIKRIIVDSILYLKTKNINYKNSFNYLIMIIIGTIPACIIGLLVKDIIEHYFNIKLVSIALLITSLFLYLVKDKDGYKKEIKIKDAVIIGLYQAVALIPGISRSGSTIVGCLNQDLEKETSVNYSFMLYIPISIATSILGLKDLLTSSNKSLTMPYFISLIVSCIVTYFSTKLFIKIIKEKKLIIFSIYCLIVGLITFFVI